MYFWLVSFVALIAFPSLWALPRNLYQRPPISGTITVNDNSAETNDDFIPVIAPWDTGNNGVQLVNSEPISKLDIDGNFTVIDIPEKPKSAPWEGVVV